MSKYKLLPLFIVIVVMFSCVSAQLFATETIGTVSKDNDLVEVLSSKKSKNPESAFNEGVILVKTKTETLLHYRCN